jgi:hypothetical protein
MLTVNYGPKNWTGGRPGRPPTGRVGWPGLLAQCRRLSPLRGNGWKSRRTGTGKVATGRLRLARRGQYSLAGA